MPTPARWAAYPAVNVRPDGSTARSPFPSQCQGVWLVPARWAPNPTSTVWVASDDWWARSVRLPAHALRPGDAELGCSCVLPPGPTIAPLHAGEWLIVLFLHPARSTNFKELALTVVKPLLLPALGFHVIPPTDAEVQNAINVAFMPATQRNGGHGHMTAARWQPPPA